MPAHYALSDAAIVVAGLWGMRLLWQSGRVLLAGAMLCFAVPAAIGTVRFATGLTQEFAELHMGTSALMGLTGVGLLLAGLLLDRQEPKLRLIGGVVTVVLASVLFALEEPLAPIMGVMLAIAIGVALYAAIRQREGWPLVAGLTVLLANSAFVRRAPWLSEGAAWHAFHVLVALGLVLVVLGLRPTRPQHQPG